MEWRTTVELAKVFPDDATITQPETTAVVEAARAICYLVQIGQIVFDLVGNLIEEWVNNANIRMKENIEKRRKRKLDDETMLLLQTIHTRIPHPFLQTFQPRSQQERWQVRGLSNWVQGPNGWLSLRRPSQVRIVVILRLHRGETNLCGESLRRKQLKDC